MKLVKLDDGIFRIEDEGKLIEASWPVIRQSLIVDFDIEPDQLTRALDEMRERNHDVAEFGILNRTFMYSYASTMERKVKAELRAIRDVRIEFHKAQLEQPNGIIAKACFDRLMSLYFTQDVDGNLLLLGEVMCVDEDIAA